jgi:hypothetical protein
MDTRTEKHKKLSSTLRKAGSALAFLTFAVSAQANLVVNGGFSLSTNGPGQLGLITTATDWTSAAPEGSYNFLFSPATALTGVSSEFGTDDLSLYGVTASPDGGNFVGGDGDFPGHNGPIQQTISGLTVGDTYTVGFYWAAAQQVGFTGPTEQSWIVSLGSETQSTPTYDLPSQGFSGWMFQSFNFTATSSTETLSFLANGNLPIPPFALLDGVSLNQTPEPGYWIPGVGLVGLMAVLGVRRSKRLVKS